MTDFLFLDSGLGALPYVMALKKKAPSANCVYFADNLHFPYGEKSEKEIIAAAVSAVESAVSLFCPKVIVIACNTITVNSLAFLKSRFPSVLFVGTVPAIKIAARLTKTERIALLSTKSVACHPYTASLISRFAPSCSVVLHAAPSLIEFIETSLFTASFDEKVAFCRTIFEPLIKENYDTLVLGCTHFLNIKEEIRTAWGENRFVADSLEGVTAQALRLHMPSSSKCEKTKLFFSASEKGENYRLLARKFDLELFRR